MWKKALNIVFVILFLVSLIFNGYSFYQLRHFDATEVIYLHDTVTIKKDSIITKTKYKTVFDTIVEIQYKDTVLYDTVYLPIEYKVSEFELKKDSLIIREKIHHHGFKSEIDSVEFSYDWQYTFKPKKKKFGWCITVGPSINYGITLDVQNKTWTHGPSAGFSIVIGPSYIIK